MSGGERVVARPGVPVTVVSAPDGSRAATVAVPEMIALMRWLVEQGTRRPELVLEFPGLDRAQAQVAQEMCDEVAAAVSARIRDVLNGLLNQEELWMSGGAVAQAPGSGKGPGDG